VRARRRAFLEFAPGFDIKILAWRNLTERFVNRLEQ